MALGGLLASHQTMSRAVDVCQLATVQRKQQLACKQDARKVLLPF